jgi:hypothetical protein
LLFETSQLKPNLAAFAGALGPAREQLWAETQDFRVLRNRAEYPRAWVVHDAREASPALDAESLRRRQTNTMREILYAPDAIWNERSRPVYDPRKVAWVAQVDLTALRPYLSGSAPGASETVSVTYSSPEQAVLEVTLDSPGLVVLADIHYPGWELAIDAISAPIYRVNGAMRGAAVSAGRHRLVYSYRPRTFKIGWFVSIAGLAALVALGLACMRWPSVAALREGDNFFGIDSPARLHR